MTGLFITAVFLFLAYLMYTSRMPATAALPLLAVIISIVAGLPYFYDKAPGDADMTERLWFSLGCTLDMLLSVVFKKGIPRLQAAIITVILGSIFGQYIKLSGIAEGLVRRVAELAGDNVFIVSLILSLVTSFLFTTLGGLGAVIMIANIVFPLLLSLGVPALTAAGVFLLSMCLGGVFNLVNWKFYVELLGMNIAAISSFALPFGCLYLLTLIVFLARELGRAGLGPFRKDSGVTTLVLLLAALAAILSALLFGGADLLQWITTSAGRQLSWMKPVFLAGLVLLFLLPSGKSEKAAMAAPFIPIGLVLFLGRDINSSFVVGIIYLLKHAPGPGRSRRLIESAVEGVNAVASAIALMMGIGMLLMAVTQPPVAQSLAPLVSAVLPHSRLTYVLLFGLCAPLALYRGPLNVWGMGSGLLKLFQTAAVLSNVQILGVFMSTGQVQGVCDPTNTHNVWISGHLGVGLDRILSKTLPYMWALSFAGLALAALLS